MKHERTFTYSFFNELEEAPAVYQKLIHEARKAQKKAYAPYSNFAVGSALELENGLIIHGSNQENKAYPDGLCAERTALFAYGANHAEHKIIRLAIVGDGDLLPKNGLLSPCGSCRQVMAEYTARQESPFEIIMLNGNNSVIAVESIEQLLPFTFGTER